MEGDLGWIGLAGESYSGVTGCMTREGRDSGGIREVWMTRGGIRGMMTQGGVDDSRYS